MRQPTGSMFQLGVKRPKQDFSSLLASVPALYKPAFPLRDLISIIKRISSQPFTDELTVTSRIDDRFDLWFVIVLLQLYNIVCCTPPLLYLPSNCPVNFSNTIVSLSSDLISWWDFERNIFIIVCFHNWSQKLVKNRRKSHCLTYWLNWPYCWKSSLNHYVEHIF